MRRKGRPRRASTTVAMLAATVTAVLAAGCTGGHGPADDGRAHTPTPAPDRSAVGKSPVAKGSVLAVKIDNAPGARPQTGLDAADVVYAEQVEGGLSRLMAVYAGTLPRVVGPVRSARESDLELLRQFHDPLLAFSGAQHKLLPLIDDAPLQAETPAKVSDAYFRGPGRAAPHNLYLRPARLMKSAPGADALTTGFRYGAAPAGGKSANTRTVRYPAAGFTFTWSANLHRYLVAMDGTPTVTAEGKRVTPATVVVQYVRMHKSAFHDVLGNNTPYTETVGSGTAQVLRDGRVYDVNWERGKATDGTEFTTKDGKPVNFAKGQVWVVLAQAS
ncbi:DUF3048 domain-containing protein [Streptomyces sp. NBC_00201]|uniref:DUF3048 domain-containing protein n=1 Tax=unclassified Streptomyces TaxID=2593676 RepID=UPI002254251F|nr:MULTISPECIES: DUF3048 domain-containing protein [unclassified Streptomyces]MCX5250500.1 DUF3048 domain-containing protein [Streptomyces sp. NBC_00201]MCX5291573.1 DUF3048 domain-containing protein [Streptomyces sp. NBC_00183]